MFSSDDYFVDAPAADGGETEPAATPEPPPVPPGAPALAAAPADTPAEPTPTTPGLRPPSASATARYAPLGNPLGPTPLPFGVSQGVSRTGSAYSPCVPPLSPKSERALPPSTPLPLGAPRRPSAQSRVPTGMPTRTVPPASDWGRYALRSKRLWKASSWRSARIREELGVRLA
eukprot:3205419-Prymnesium_polylepis.2